MAIKMHRTQPFSCLRVFESMDFNDRTYLTREPADETRSKRQQELIEEKDETSELATRSSSHFDAGPHPEPRLLRSSHNSSLCQRTKNCELPHSCPHCLTASLLPAAVAKTLPSHLFHNAADGQRFQVGQRHTQKMRMWSAERSGRIACAESPFLQMIHPEPEIRPISPFPQTPSLPSKQ